MTPIGDFGAALQAMRCGARVAREGWNGKGMWLRLVQPADGDPSRLPRYPVRAHVEMKDAQGWLVPWLASQTDLLAQDWCDVTDEPMGEPAP